MSEPSGFPEAPPAGRGLRLAGVVALVLVQGLCAFVAQGLWRLVRQARDARPPRHLAAPAATGPVIEAVSGYVDRLEDGIIGVVTVQDVTVVRVDRHTAYRTERGPGGPGAVRPGHHVGVAGDTGPDGVVLADVVVIRPPQ